MRIINVAAILGDLLESELGLTGPLEQIRFIHHGHCDVYRISGGGQGFIAHVSRHCSDYLNRLRQNLLRVAALGEDRIPRVVAWRESPDDGWAVLVCREIPGDELNRATATTAVLNSLADLLFELHSLPVSGDKTNSGIFSVDDPRGFPGFAEMFLARIADLPIRPARAKRHLDEMAAYLEEHADHFHVTPRPIHADLHRSNIVVCGSRVGLLDWGDLSAGDYAFDLATLKFVLDALVPNQSPEFIRQRANFYRDRLQDGSLETRLRYFLALAGLVRAFHCATDTSAFGPGRAWRVRACYLHSEAQWRSPLRLDGPDLGAPAVITEDWAVDMRQPIRGLFFLLAPKKVL